MTGKFIDYMVQTNPSKYKKHIHTEHGKKVLYLRVLKALYGCIKSGILWHKLLFQKHGSVLNPYDLCVANKITSEKQCTIT